MYYIIYKIECEDECTKRKGWKFLFKCNSVIFIVWKMYPNLNTGFVSTEKQTQMHRLEAFSLAFSVKAEKSSPRAEVRGILILVISPMVSPPLRKQESIGTKSDFFSHPTTTTITPNNLPNSVKNREEDNQKPTQQFPISPYKMRLEGVGCGEGQQSWSHHLLAEWWRKFSSVSHLWPSSGQSAMVK